MDDITKEVVSMLKARKNVVDGKDKTKALDQNDLRNKVLDELDISDSDRGDAKKMFNDVIEKLEKKDAIKVDGDGDVKWVPIPIEICWLPTCKLLCCPSS